MGSFPWVLDTDSYNIKLLFQKERKRKKERRKEGRKERTNRGREGGRRKGEKERRRGETQSLFSHSMGYPNLIFREIDSWFSMIWSEYSIDNMEATCYLCTAGCNINNVTCPVTSRLYNLLLSMPSTTMKCMPQSQKQGKKGPCFISGFVFLFFCFHLYQKHFMQIASLLPPPDMLQSTGKEGEGSGRNG
jgi:hypothetical protein